MYWTDLHQIFRIGRTCQCQCEWNSISDVACYAQNCFGRHIVWHTWSNRERQRRRTIDWILCRLNLVQTSAFVMKSDHPCAQKTSDCLFSIVRQVSHATACSESASVHGGLFVSLVRQDLPDMPRACSPESNPIEKSIPIRKSNLSETKLFSS